MKPTLHMKKTLHTEETTWLIVALALLAAAPLEARDTSSRSAPSRAGSRPAS